MSDIVPQIRKDLAYKEIKSTDSLEDADFILLYDPQEIADEPLQLPIGFIPLLQMLNGHYSFTEIQKSLEVQVGEQAESIIQALKKIIETLDEFYFLESENFFQRKDELDEFLKSDVRKPICSGMTYSSNPEVLNLEIQNIMDTFHSDIPEIHCNAIIAPHIDYRVNSDAQMAYSSVYQSLSGNDSELYVILGTSHFGSGDFFMFTKKEYSTPLGIVKTDFEILNELQSTLSFDLTYDEIAHFKEHSIELQLPFIQYINPEKEIKILPILIGSFHEFISVNGNPINDKKISEFYEKLKFILDKSGKKYSVISAVDFSHVGYKFGDNFDSSEKSEEIKIEDMNLINNIINFDADAFFASVAECKDKNKICGISPIYSMLKSFDFNEARLLHYGQWYEDETKSTVSFAGLAFNF